MSNPSSTIMQPSDSASEQLNGNGYSDGTPYLYDMEQNYANSNKWFCYLPLEDVLGKQYKNLNMHITRFSLPALEQSSQTVSYRGYEKEIPAKVLNPTSKQFTVDYIIDSNWMNYESLMSWTSGVVGVINPIATDASEQKDTISASDYVPMRIYLLGPYKRKIIQFYFSNCWIKSFGDLELDVNNPGEISHSFTAVFDEFTVERCK